MSNAKTKQPLLRVKNLRVEFPARRGTLVAVDDVSFHIDEGEVLGVVGESGAGKSLTGAAIIGLLEPPGRVANGQIIFDGKRIDNIGYEKMRRLRGDQIAMIFQDPLTSLNPLFTIGRQLTETIRSHVRIDERAARKRAIELLNEVGIPAADRRIDQYPHQFSGGMRQPGACGESAPYHRRRTDNGSGRFHSGADHHTAETAMRGPWHVGHADYP